MSFTTEYHPGSNGPGVGRIRPNVRYEPVVQILDASSVPLSSTPLALISRLSICMRSDFAFISLSNASRASGRVSFPKGPVTPG